MAKHIPDFTPEVWGSAPKEVILDLLSSIDRDYGSVAAYLTSIGFDGTWQQRLRDEFLLK